MAIFDTELLNYQKVKFKNLVLAYVDLQNIRLLHNYVPMHAHACPYSTLAASCNNLGDVPFKGCPERHGGFRETLVRTVC